MTSPPTIYLDHSATTPVDPRVVDAMMPYFTVDYGNASSSHGFGRRAETAIEDARDIIAGIMNCKRSEIVFTGCGSESDHLAVRGSALLSRRQGKSEKIITTPMEHSAITGTVRQLADLMGFEAVNISVDSFGFVKREQFEDACRNGAAIASIIYANNELGTIQPLGELSEIAYEHSILFHTDAVQAGGQLNLDVQALGVDMLSLSAHKFYGPKGVGLLYIRDGIDIIATQSGGSHEQGRRAGTHNTPLIVGMAKALEIAYAELDQHIQHYQAMRTLLVDGVLSRIPNAQLTGHPEKRLPSHASFVFDGIDSSVLLMHLDMKGIAASGGSACKTGNPEPSGVLLAAGYSPEVAIGSLRLTVGRQTTADEITFTVDVLAETIEKLYQLNREFAG